MDSESRRLPLVAVLYQEYLDSQDSSDFADRVSRYYAQGTLERLTEHDSRQVRRASVLALGILGTYEANHAMGRALCDDDRTVRIIAENGIRNIWRRAAENDEHFRQLSTVIRLNAAKQYAEAKRRATGLIEASAAFAEAWHQRAVANLALGSFAESIRDCHQALELNPYHFQAAFGLGQAYVQINRHVSALESFRRALRLNPDLENARAQVARLRGMIEDK